jgi:DNA-binding NtrC family response regulator
MNQLKKFTIAHIDDDPIVLDMTRLVLEQNENLEISSYSTAEEFLGSIDQKGEPQLIIVDYFLNSKVPSAMSGSKLIEIFRKQSDQIPFIVISSQKKISVGLKLIKLRVVDYIVKTDDFTSKVVRSVNSVIQIRQKEFEKRVADKIIRKDKMHLMIVSLFFIATISIIYFVGKLLV